MALAKLRLSHHTKVEKGLVSSLLGLTRLPPRNEGASSTLLPLLSLLSSESP